MSQTAIPGNDTGSVGNIFTRPIAAPAPSDDQPQDSHSEEPAPEDDIPEDDDPAGETGETQEEPEEPGDDTDPADPEKKRFKYWQSQADKAKAENQRLKTELETFQKVPKEAIDLAATLLESPDVAEVVNEYLTTGKRPAQPAQPTGAREQLKSLTRPQAPVMPENFDEDDALTDPKSESAKFVREEKAYNKALQEYLLKREELRDLAEQEVEAERIQQQRAADFERQTRHQLATKFNIPAAEHDDFFQVVNTPPTLDDAVLYYKAKKGLLKAAAATAQKKQELDKKADLAKKNPPPPGAKGAPASGEPIKKSIWSK